MADSKKENNGPVNTSNSDKPPSARTRSSYHLESNPFEVSFSQPHPNPSIPAFAPPSPTRRESVKDASDQKPKLPSIASMASPAGTSDFAWPFNAGSGTADNSLRSGPLSPAMLAGPAQYSHHSAVGAGGVPGFDGIRTGLTPDVSRTGLTPLIGGPTSYPPPSPNTAAFLAIVNGNAGSAPGTQPATITPGTFSAITGAMLNPNATTNASDLSSTSPTQSHHPHPHGPHPLSVSHLPGGAENAEDPAHTAANGLFLLSQAHHELTKREEQQQAQQHQQQIQQQVHTTQPATGTARNSTRRNTNASSNSAAQDSSANNKRKNNSSSAAAANIVEPASKKARGAVGGRSANNNVTTTSSGRTVRHTRKRSESTADDEDDDMDMDMDMQMGAGSDEDELEAAARVGTGSGGKNPTPMMKKPETEEEKRRNFLERNRQAALKCRQRKKAWLNQLQAKVEYLTAENERLQNVNVNMREEISRLSAVVIAHRDCGLGGVSVARSEQLLADTAGMTRTGSSGGSTTAIGSGGLGGAGGASSGGEGGGGVPSNAPAPKVASSTTNGGGNGANNGSGATNGVTTRRSARAPSSSPVPQPPPASALVSVGGKRYSGY